ncbi:hypothetical protein [Streptomyces sp. UNOB3_S3]|uniref:hypothetical protein n=1 Tax=Streptomyces sp. UNOB3_S3 TaxID=2871682 RepID=UPI001E50A849|nr:hypothetical protein [Streptomyces sp. UNOB3_S3]MCC3773977.1 hypothetical protein [Streptomyces sp. UNOB3_S3]
MPVISLMLTILFSGVAGAFATWWLVRARVSLTMVSISKGIETSGTTEMPDLVVELVADFPWGVPLAKESTAADARTCYEICQRIIKEAPSVRETIRDVRKELPRASDREEKEQLLYKMLDNFMLCATVEGALSRRELDLGRPARVSPPPSHEESGSPPPRPRGVDVGPASAEEQEDSSPGRLFNVTESVFEDEGLQRPQFHMSFSHNVTKYTLGWSDFEVSHEPFRDYLIALQRFDKQVIQQVLGYAEQAFERDRLRAHAVMAALDNVFAHDPFEISAVAVNHGGRVAVLNPYGALATEGGSKQIPPASLRVVKVVDGSGREEEVREEHPVYISLEPQSTKRLTLVSEKLENSQLRSAYESEILRCSIVMLQQRRGRKESKKVHSPSKDFGARLMEELKSEAISAVKE